MIKIQYFWIKTIGKNKNILKIKKIKKITLETY